MNNEDIPTAFDDTDLTGTFRFLFRFFICTLAAAVLFIGGMIWLIRWLING